MLKRTTIQAFWVALVGAGLMVAMVVSLRQSSWPFPDTPPGPGTNRASAESIGSGDAAMRYVRALQEGNCDEVIAMTLWMQERIKQVRLQNPDGVADIREELCASLSDRRLEGNQLSEEGMEDHYVFAPGTTLTLLNVEEGPADLARPAASRAWIRVEYARRDRAPLSADGEPVRSLVAKVSTTADAFVLKAAVIGNTEIDPELVDTDWDTSGGER